jgi:nucleoside-diphosphate-sugar epimerase
MKILITGAGGFVGQLLASHLLGRDEIEVVLADIVEPTVPTAAKHRHNARCIKADISAAPETVLSKDLDAIYAFHGIMSAGSEANFDLGYQVNLYSNLKLLDAIRRVCPGVKVIFSSSVGIFGQPLPDQPLSEATTPTPQSCYGIQKAMIELAINDYTRRGFINGFTLRLPTISPRAGKATQAASNWVSGIIREPLHGVESELPVDDDFRVWICSPTTLAKNLMHVLTLPRDCMPEHIRQTHLPGITVTVREMMSALEEVGGSAAAGLVKRVTPSPEISAILHSWPPALDDRKAQSLGFVGDQSFLETVKEFKAAMLNS